MVAIGAGSKGLAEHVDTKGKLKDTMRKQDDDRSTLTGKMR